MIQYVWGFRKIAEKEERESKFGAPTIREASLTIRRKWLVSGLLPMGLSVIY
jgi:hypothetical protein